MTMGTEEDDEDYDCDEDDDDDGDEEEERWENNSKQTEVETTPGRPFGELAAEADRRLFRTLAFSFWLAPSVG